jgi:hypothetical protein
MPGTEDPMTGSCRDFEHAYEMPMPAALSAATKP